MAKKRDKQQKRKNNTTPLYMKNIIDRKIKLPFRLVGGNINQIILQKLSRQLEGRCSNEGFIKPNSISIITHSSGIVNEDYVIFDVGLECLICRPVEGMKISCVVRNVTKAGIRAEIDNPISPLIIFIARDHNYQSAYFSSRKEGDNIVIRVIGQRFELNDKHISVIATLIEPK